jgi:CHAT domain-containing protein
MEPSQLAAQLIAGGAAERAALLDRYAAQAGVELAWALKACYDDTRTRDPAQASAAAAALAALAEHSGDEVVLALNAWTRGRAALQLDGEPRRALPLLDEAATAFEALGSHTIAATVQVTRLHALALLGEYDEAIAIGVRARDILLAHDELLTAATIEQNLGNIFHRRDQYVEAERLLRQARERFLALGDKRQLAQIENNIAIELMFQHRFQEAAALYDQARVHAAQTESEVTQAEIEVNLGNLAMFQGQYDRALALLEQGRRRYAALGMPHELATVELELADAYLELNLLPEAATLYERIVPTFRTLGMRAELARTLAHLGRAATLDRTPAGGYALLDEAAALYLAEANPVGAAVTTLFRAQALYAAGDYDGAREAAIDAGPPLQAANAWSWWLFARWLHGEIERVAGEPVAAQKLLEATLAAAERLVAPQVVYHCYASLGMVAVAHGDMAGAERWLSRAVTLLEELRAPLPAEEFYTAFVADKLAPYEELVRLYLRDGRVEAAFAMAERARSQALVRMLGDALPARPKPRDAFEAGLLARLAELREQLNWLYTQIGQPSERDAAESAVAMADLQTAVRERESAALELNRQLMQRSTDGGGGRRPLANDEALTRLQRQLGVDTVLVEYFALDGELLAFAVTREDVSVAHTLGREEEIAALIEQLRGQIETLRYGDARMLARLELLTQRVRHHLKALYDVLLRPVQQYLGERRLVVAPYRALHYVPFHALDDGTGFVIERREVCYAPSAAVLEHCLAQPHKALQHAVLFGVAGEQLPRVYDELDAIGPLFPAATMLLDEQATRAQLFAHAPSADLLHLACHAQFRPDNPLFSSLRLGDGWLTVYDAYALDLACGLVTLSACETGVSSVAPGDELLGLARGFFSAGVPSLVVSLWAADDVAAAQLMHSFYTYLCAGQRPAAALRHAQLLLMRQHSHPYYWAPFVVMGRW